MTSAPDAAFWASESDALMALLTPYLNTAASDGADAAAAQLADETGQGVDIAVVNIDIQEWLGSYARTLVSGVTNTTETFVEKAVRTWMDSGAPLDDLITALTPAFGESRAELVAITEATRAYHQGGIAVWSQVDIVTGYTFHVVDGDACEICLPLDGQTFALDDDEHAPPQHGRCRCYSQPAVTLP